MEATPHQTATVRPLTSHLISYPRNTNKTCGTLLEKQGRTYKWRSSLDAGTDMPVLADQQELIHINCIRTLDVVYRTCQERWLIGTDGERESGKSALSGQLDHYELTCLNFSQAITFNLGQIPLENVWSPLFPQLGGVNSTTTVHLQGWLWY